MNEGDIFALLLVVALLKCAYEKWWGNNTREGVEYHAKRFRAQMIREGKDPQTVDEYMDSVRQRIGFPRR